MSFGEAHSNSVEAPAAQFLTSTLDKDTFILDAAHKDPESVGAHCPQFNTGFNGSSNLSLVKMKVMRLPPPTPSHILFVSGLPKISRCRIQDNNRYGIKHISMDIFVSFERHFILGISFNYVQWYYWMP